MKTKLFILFLGLFTVVGCSSDDSNSPNPIHTNKVMLLLVDQTTNEFEGGKEMPLSQTSTDFTIHVEYKEPTDFGSVKLYHKELSKLLFYGEIFKKGKGNIIYPESILSASSFEKTLTSDFVSPANGFDRITIDPTIQLPDFQAAWASIQSVVKVRDYLKSNSNQKVKVFLYTPSLEEGQPQDWKWGFLIKS